MILLKTTIFTINLSGETDVLFLLACNKNISPVISESHFHFQYTCQHIIHMYMKVDIKLSYHAIFVLFKALLSSCSWPETCARVCWWYLRLRISSSWDSYGWRSLLKKRILLFFILTSSWCASTIAHTSRWIRLC